MIHSDMSQDAFSCNRPKFGDGGHLQVIGWCGKISGVNRYAVECSMCKLDPEIWGDGIFYAAKGHLLRGVLPCGCSKKKRLNWQQKRTLMLRGGSINPDSKAQDDFSCLGLNFGSLSVVAYAGKDETGHKWYVVECSECKENPKTNGDARFVSRKGDIASGSRPCGCANIPKSKREDSQLKIAEAKADSWSRLNIKFGNSGQISVIGWIGRSGSNKQYVVRCSECAKDSELFGDGLFAASRGKLEAGRIPCGCSKRFSWSKSQYKVLIRRIAEKRGYEFLGFCDETVNSKTKIRLKCRNHGEFSSENIGGFIFSGRMPTKPREFYGEEHCECARISQREAYINFVYDDKGDFIAIKFGVSGDSRRRIKEQACKTNYRISQNAVYEFKTKEECRAAETECKRTIARGILSKEEMPDGYTETTNPVNAPKIEEIYRKHGGVKSKS